MIAQSHAWRRSFELYCINRKELISSYFVCVALSLYLAHWVFFLATDSAFVYSCLQKQIEDCPANVKATILLMRERFKFRLLKCRGSDNFLADLASRWLCPELDDKEIEVHQRHSLFSSHMTSVEMSSELRDDVRRQHEDLPGSGHTSQHIEDEITEKASSKLPACLMLQKDEENLLLLMNQELEREGPCDGSLDCCVWSLAKEQSPATVTLVHEVPDELRRVAFEKEQMGGSDPAWAKIGKAGAVITRTEAWPDTIVELESALGLSTAAVRGTELGSEQREERLIEDDGVGEKKGLTTAQVDGVSEGGGIHGAPGLRAQGAPEMGRPLKEFIEGGGVVLQGVGNAELRGGWQGGSVVEGSEAGTAAGQGAPGLEAQGDPGVGKTLKEFIEGGGVVLKGVGDATLGESRRSRAVVKGSGLGSGSSKGP